MSSAPLAERRQAEHEDLQAVVEVLAELARGDPLREVAVRRADEADVDPERARLADAPDLAVLEGAQELRLERERHLGDLVEEQRPAVGRLEQALPVSAVAPVKAPRAWPNSSDSSSSAGSAATFDRRRTAVLPRGLAAWTRARDDLLARPALARGSTTGASESAKSCARRRAACMAGLPATRCAVPRGARDDGAQAADLAGLVHRSGA